MPVRIGLTMDWNGQAQNSLRLAARIWGIEVLVFPDRKSRRSRWVARKLFGWLERLITSKMNPPTTDEPRAPKSVRKPPGLDFLIWAAAQAKNLLLLVTRRLELRCGGVDPAALGAFTGVVAIVQGVVGTRKLVWLPDFAPGPVRLRVDWELSVSVWKFVSWIGESFVDKKRRGRRNASGFVPSSV